MGKHGDEARGQSACFRPFPKEGERLVARCLRKDPDRRIQTIADLKVPLQQFKDESDSGSLRGVAPPAVAPAKRRKLAWAAVSDS
jgi:hypothetical protein